MSQDRSRAFNVWFDGRCGPIRHHLTAGHIDVEAEGDMEAFGAAYEQQILADTLLLAFEKPNGAQRESVLLIVNNAAGTSLAVSHVRGPTRRSSRVRVGLLYGSVLGRFTYDTLSSFPLASPNWDSCELAVDGGGCQLVVERDALGYVKAVTEGAAQVSVRRKAADLGLVRRVGAHAELVYWSTRDSAGSVVVDCSAHTFWGVWTSGDPMQTGVISGQIC